MPKKKWRAQTPKYKLIKHGKLISKGLQKYYKTKSSHFFRQKSKQSSYKIKKYFKTLSKFTKNDAEQFKQNIAGKYFVWMNDGNKVYKVFPKDIKLGNKEYKFGRLLI